MARQRLYSREALFWGQQQHRSQREMLSAMVGGFDKDVLEKFYALSTDQFARLLNVYSAEYGEGAADYAREVYDEWKAGIESRTRGDAHRCGSA